MSDCVIYPSICRPREITMVDAECQSLHFEGITDVTINQGVGIDLAEGITAYDAYGEEIPFTYDPSEIDECDVGEHTVKYTAYGATTMTITMPCYEDKISLPEECTEGMASVQSYRTVTITQADPPVFDGLENLFIDVGDTVYPAQGVTATDDNGVDIPFHYISGGVQDEPSTTYDTQGLYTITYTATDECGNTTTESIYVFCGITCAIVGEAIVGDSETCPEVS